VGSRRNDSSAWDMVMGDLDLADGRKCDTEGEAEVSSG
jgi:hypothetical protein